MMQMTQGRQQQRSETPEKQQPLHDKAATRKRQREAESPDQSESGRLKGPMETPTESSSCNRANSNIGTSNELVCVSSRACSE